MQDWVRPYLNKDPRYEGYFNGGYSKEHYEKIKGIDFNCIERNTDYRSTFLGFSEVLMKGLNCFFDREPGKDNEICENFKIIFGSVLADLTKDKFDALCKGKNTFFIYGPGVEAYFKGFNPNELNITLDEKEHFKIVIFNHEIATFPWFVSRFIVVHEFVHIILYNLNDPKCLNDPYVNKKIQEWGFIKETEEIDEWNLEEKRKQIQDCIKKVIKAES